MPRFYLDENLHGKRFSEELEANGIEFETCVTLDLRGTDDAYWIPYVTAHGLIIVTGDRRTRYLRAISSSRAPS